ncbi:LysR family transcriptional regulator [Streptomyces endophyticus]|uniref:LysR family transcriptional regulator n=1 Tax=Streptomyces endophyticus TaxID=714166 RepID=A0ABU6EZ43_9ACTN|nr:LysR family transcriptional regulator [Streptomyces endophyticus]MEB8336989.1 LysR family transcriptional regulator [Streptomyces endophyticus]
MIDPRLQTLRVLRDQGTVTATARMLHLTPSTVSQQLRQLADQVGVQLLEPDGRRVRLTPAALALIRHADALFARWEEASADLAAYGQDHAGRLRITGAATAIAAVIAPAARQLLDAYPRMTVEIGEDHGENRYDLLLTERADIAVVIPVPGAPARDDARFTRLPLLEEPLDVLVPSGHRFAARTGGVELSEAAEEIWIRAGDPLDQEQLLTAAGAAAGFTPRTSHAAVDWYAVAALVAHGHGIALVPRLAPVPRQPELVRVPLRGAPAPVRRFAACVRRGGEEHPVIAQGLSALRAAAAAAVAVATAR